MSNTENTTEVVEEVVERPYTLRKLRDGDLMPVLTILRKVGLREFKDVFKSITDGKSDEEVGLNIILEMASIVASNIPLAETEIYDLCASLSGIDENKIREMEFGTVPLMIYDAFGEVKNTAFFKVLSKLL